MPPKFIFIHIRKSAGTSFRSLAFDSYGPEQVFWSLDGEEQPIKEAFLDDTIKIIGGHFSYALLKNIFGATLPTEAILSAIVRHPVDRVLSLFNHHRTKAKLQNIVPGFDEDSLYRTLRDCEQFRDMCHNDQCFSISGYRSFKETADHIKKHPYIIGVLAYLNSYEKAISNMLGWNLTAFPKGNRGYGRYSKTEDITPATTALLKELLAEDFKLYRFLCTHRLYRTPGFHLDRIRDIHEPFFNPLPLNGTERAKVQLRITTPTINPSAGEEISVPVTIINRATTPLPASGFHSVKISYHVFNKKNDVVEWDGLRTDLPEDIPPGKEYTTEAKIVVPSVPGNYIIKIGLLYKGIGWFESDNINHEQEIHCTVTS